MHKYRERFRETVLPADVPPIGELSSQSIAHQGGPTKVERGARSNKT